MSNSVWLNDDGIIEIRVLGNQTYDTVTKMGEDAEELLASLKILGKPGLILDDITELGNTDIAARKKVASLANTLPFERVAMLGDGSVVMRVGTNLLLRAVGKGRQIRYFEDRAKAVEWLLSGK